MPPAVPRSSPPPAEGPPPIPFIDLAAQRRRLGPRLEAAVARVLGHGAYILGPEVEELERRLAAFCGVRHAVTCANGTDALVLALMAHGIGAGSAVFVPAFTFAATAEAVALAGATPVFVDVEEASFNLDPARLEAALADPPRAAGTPAAVIAVDLFGQPADYAALAPIARRHGLLLMADAAQSFGAERDGRRSGALGDIATTSFYPAKPLGCYGDGGALFTDDDATAGRLRSLRAHGEGAERYDNRLIGMNSRLDTLQAAILLEKLAIFEEELTARQRVAERYAAVLAGLAALPTVAAGARSSWAQYTIRLEGRDRVAASLKAAGIPTAVHYPRPLHRQPAYRGYPTAPGGLLVAERLAERVLSLPMHPYLEPAIQDRIATALRAALAA